MTGRGLMATMGVLAGLAVGATGAAADGGPSPGVMTGGAGVTAPGTEVRYVTLSDGRRTVVEAVTTRTGTVRRFLWLRGSYGIPMVAYDGTVEGLSRDGRTLVLAPWLGPQPLRTTKFAIIDAGRLRVRRIVALRGMFSYDALSPDGRTLYVIQYLASQDAPRYLVRAYDLAARRLIPGAIADRREQGPMTGSPVARASGADGRWVFTLYSRPDEPFVHALDTVNGRAVCVDLPWRGIESVLATARLRLERGDRRLVIDQPRGAPMAVIDTRTWKVQALWRH